MGRNFYMHETLVRCRDFRQKIKLRACTTILYYYALCIGGLRSRLLPVWGTSRASIPHEGGNSQTWLNSENARRHHKRHHKRLSLRKKARKNKSRSQKDQIQAPQPLVPWTRLSPMLAIQLRWANLAAKSRQMKVQRPPSKSW